MKNTYVKHWEEIRLRMEDWWHGCNEERPIFSIQVLRRSNGGEEIKDGWVSSSSGTIDARELAKQASSMAPDEAKKYWTDFETLMARNKRLFDNSYYTGDTYPKFAANIGVGSLALFLGCSPSFTKDTIWYEPALNDPETDHLVLDKENPWLQWSLETTRAAKERSGGEFLVGLPDITEHLDILASLYPAQELMFHMIDYPDELHGLLREIQEIWYEVYQMHYEIIADKKGWSSSGPFQLWGKGKIAKLQCDVSAMISRDMFDEFALPYLREQTQWLDKSMYHLDGVDAVKHLDSVLSLEGLNALQWTPGAGQPDGGDETWDFIYEKALDHGKSIYALVSPQNIPRFVKRFGTRGVYIMTVAKDEAMADAIVAGDYT